MTKKLLVFLAICSFAFTSISGCSSNESKSDDADIAMEGDATAFEDSVDGLEGDVVDGGDSLDGGDLAADSLPEESLDGDLADDDGLELEPDDSTAVAQAEPTDDAAELELDSPDAPAEDPLAQNAAPLETEPELEDPAPPTPSENVADYPPADEPAPTYDTASYDDPEPTPAPKNRPLQKIPDRPWRQSGLLLNAVYFARPGDTLSGISQMIYGADKTAELKKANPKLKSRDPKPSEKVFYNSPVRPEDDQRLLTYYEDAGMPPETYVAKEGDTIQDVGKNLLGYDNGWKEIWPINSVESKGRLEPGTELKYWRGGAVASNMPPPPPPAEMAPPAMDMPPPPPPMMDNSGGMPPPPGDMAMNNEMPPPPPPPMDVPPPPMDMESPPDMAMNDLPPPPPPEMAPPPPPPPPPPMDNKPMAAGSTKASAQDMDEETMMTLGIVGAAALILGALLVARRKRRQRELEAAFNETQVGT